MSKSKNTENKFRNENTAQKVTAVIQQSQLAKLYTVAVNTNVDKTNRVAIFNESIENAKQIVESMHLQQDFMQAVARCTVWLDETQIVFFIGAVYTVHVSISAKKADKQKAQRYSELYKQSIDNKYNERKLKNKTITALTETRHTFNDVETFTEFFNLFSELVALRVTAQQADKQKASEKAQQKADNKQKAQQTSKQKAESKQKKQKAEIDADKLTKEIISAVQKKA